MLAIRTLSGTASACRRAGGGDRRYSSQGRPRVGDPWGLLTPERATSADYLLRSDNSSASYRLQLSVPNGAGYVILTGNGIIRGFQ